ncbi:MAG: DUF1460 domain-containing protein [Gemmatimonadetes bacterium]|nr:DUF1460 domain-containing protein [Gemmatimonadota bacterium]
MSGRRWAIRVGVLGVAVLALWQRSPSGQAERHATAEGEVHAQAAEVRTGQAGAGAGPAAPAYGERAQVGPTDREADRRIFEDTMDRALLERLDTLPIGDRMVRFGRWFLGTEYVPKTLEVAGPERLVVNLRQLDCVTYLENLLAMARVLGSDNPSFEAFLAELQRIRYRGGVINGYASRLHYFSEWIADNESRGLLRDVTREIGGVALDEPIDFMSTHSDAYRQLESPEQLARIREIEGTLSARTRHYVPERRIAEVESRIRDGDIIAATSTITGLDIAHTGMAVWIDGRLHLMHAPLVGKDVQISELPLVERILRIEGQDGIMVARPR